MSPFLWGFGVTPRICLCVYTKAMLAKKMPLYTSIVMCLVGRHPVDFRPWFSPAFHARLCRCSVFAVVVPRMAGIQLSRCRWEEKSFHISGHLHPLKSRHFLKFLSLIRKWGGVKVNHGSEKIFILSLIPNFRPQFVNPGRWNFRYLIVWRRTLLYIRTFEGVKVNPSPKVFEKPLH